MPCFFARLLIVSPAACPSRSCSNSSTLPLLSIPESFHPGLTGWAKSDDQSGPNQSIELTCFVRLPLTERNDRTTSQEAPELGLLWRAADLGDHRCGNRRYNAIFQTGLVF